MYLKSGLKTEAVCVFYIENFIKILIGTHNEKKLNKYQLNLRNLLQASILDLVSGDSGHDLFIFLGKFRVIFF